MFNPGDKVRSTGHIYPDVFIMLEGKVGTVVKADKGRWDYVVHFDGTNRAGGMFGFREAQLEKVN